MTWEWIIVIFSLLVAVFSVILSKKRLETQLRQKENLLVKEFETKRKLEIEENIREKEKQLDDELSKRIKTLNDNYTERKSEIEKNITSELNRYQKTITEINGEISNAINSNQEKINEGLQTFLTYRQTKFNEELKEQEKKYKEEIANYIQKNEEQKNIVREDLNKIILELEDFKKKREVFNEDILRAKELKDNEIFYKIQLSNEDINDMKKLKEVEPYLRNKEALNKLIYEVFIKKPANDMIKRVLKGRSPAGIYKITLIETGEAYIGRSTDVSNRWLEHIKSSLNISQIAHSSFHTRMAKEGLWNFSFELLEEVDKSKLSEREKYWIDFYKTKEFGLNDKAGG